MTIGVMRGVESIIYIHSIDNEVIVVMPRVMNEMQTTFIFFAPTI